MNLTQRKQLLKKSSGQALVLAIVIFVIILLATCLIFDIQSVMHGKIRSQSAADAAAIAGANWQMNTLNMIGELNLVKASTVLISEPLWKTNETPEEFTSVPDASAFANGEVVDVNKLKDVIERVENEKSKLKRSDELVSHMQTRLAFVGPLIGFGAAQQAAKKNGAKPNEEAGAFISFMCGELSDGGIYSNENVAQQRINTYRWREPYRKMLEAILYSGGTSENGTPQGIFAVPTIKCLCMPSFSTDSGYDCIANKSLLEFALARYWCGLRDVIDAGGLPDTWWNDATYSMTSGFIGQSEILPVYVAFTENASSYYAADNAGALDDRIANRFDGYAVSMADMYDAYDPYPYDVDEAGNFTAITLFFEDANGNVTSRKVDTNVSSYPVPDNHRFVTNPDDGDFRYNVIPELSWCIFDRSRWRAMEDDEKSSWEKYLNRPFQAGKDYRYGGSAYFKIAKQASTVTGRFGSVSDVTVTAAAKPFGVLPNESGENAYPFAVSMVLPVFTDTALVPVAMEKPVGYDCDIGFLYYAADFLPLLINGNETGMFNSVREAEKSFIEDKYSQKKNFEYHAASRYIRAAELLSDQKFISEGREYLNTPVPNTNGKRRRDFCGHGSGGGRGFGGDSRTKSGPGSLH